MRILLIEDSAAQRLVLTHLLRRLGHHVTALGNAELALSHEDTFDAVVTDLALPGLGGAAMITALRAKWLQRVLIIVVSASPGTVAGADVVLAKPVTSAQLARALSGDAPLATATKAMRMDARQITALQQDLGRERVLELIRRFIDEADGICAQTTPDSVALHHLAGAAALFGALALQAAALAGNAQDEWPQTRAALLQVSGQMV